MHQNDSLLEAVLGSAVDLLMNMIPSQMTSELWMLGDCHGYGQQTSSFKAGNRRTHRSFQLNHLGRFLISRIHGLVILQDLRNGPREAKLAAHGNGDSEEFDPVVRIPRVLTG